MPARRTKGTKRKPTISALSSDTTTPANKKPRAVPSVKLVNLSVNQAVFYIHHPIYGDPDIRTAYIESVTRYAHDEDGEPLLYALSTTGMHLLLRLDELFLAHADAEKQLEEELRRCAF